ncbi:drug resistance transporter, Bcr/CflA family [Actinomyces sp. Chiba101]|uniref:multidrug effflux MFS transporter n=1 Tax=Actinomyces TaxID=1654 RepID=UPI000974DB0D|nr:MULTISPECIES: multidrug effflux MFS transporter [Actinomyces]BAW93014.1 drug resistance transporter, Bcr/CflA family [Actinomyces sp. Chiba101]GAV95768.1 drug resistance transporter, Bcr/CflA family [Actinomyces denticolens]SUU05587.1 Sulfonamide resistance protein [Actinomyces denticolens]
MNPPRNPEAPITVGLIIALAIQNAVPPFATDMYSPAFPQVAADLGTSATAVGLTLTAFFIGMGTGQLAGGTASDRYGRRHPIITGGLICTLGGIVCALAPGIGILLAGRILQGFGGGIASVVGRAVIVDVAHGDRLARIMSILMAVGGLAPMLAPVTGSAVLSLATWRMIFWCLAGFGLLMMAMAAIVIPETLPASDRRRGGLRRFAAGFAELVRHKRFMGYMLTSAFSGFAMFAYISASSFVLQEIKGLTAMQYSVFFGCTAGANMLMALTNSRLVGRYRPRRLIAVGLGISGGGIVLVTLAVLAWNAALVPLCAGFVLTMAAQGLIFGNASALALGEVRHVAGAASALMGVVQAIAMGISAPLASSGGGASATPMVAVMLTGIIGAWAAYLLVGRAPSQRRLPGV